VKPKILLCLALGLSILLPGCSTTADSSESTNLNQQISIVLTECEKIKPGMTRADLLRVFTLEGGLSTATHRTFVYRGCPCIKVDVDFTLSEPKQRAVDERPGDVISQISRPYLARSIYD
jgi:hypothetical protein